MNDLIIDACTLVNLVNGECLEILSKLPGNFHVGAIVLDECGTKREIIEKAINDGMLLELNEDEIDADIYLCFLGQYSLGEGETECLVFAHEKGMGVVSDDRKARTVAKKKVGKSRVFGSIWLLGEAVKAGVMSSEDAWDAYEKMKVNGGFLPPLDPGYFSVFQS